MDKSIDIHIKEMYNTAEILAEYSWPVVNIEDDKKVMCLKEREVYINGYDISLVLSKNKHNKHYMYTLQMYAVHGQFLPFSLVSRIARKILGHEKIYYFSVMQNDKKIYIWTVCYDLNDKLIENDGYKAVKLDSYNGLDFCRVTSIDNSYFI